MKRRIRLLAVLVASMPAQWLNYPSKGIPRLPDGKNLTAPDGKPDLSGIWQTPGPKYLANIAADLKPAEVPLQSWAREGSPRAFAASARQRRIKRAPKRS